MSCIYKYKGKDYTKEEFYSLVGNSNFIQQEQVKKFAELQERLNNKEFLEGAKNAFESSEELQNVYYEATGFTEKTDYKKEKDIFYQDVKSKYNFESTDSLLKSISNNTKNPHYKRLADTFLKIKELKEVNLIENNNLSVNGNYSLATNSININVDRILKRSNIKGYNAEFMLEQTILHEIVHALTKKATTSLERNEFIRNIENLAYKLYSKEIKDSKSDFNKYLEIQLEIKSNRENVSEEDYEFVADRQFKFYGLTNLDEFITMSMVNPDFRNKLKETTLWQELKHLIAKFLGIAKTDLDFLESNFDKFLESTYSVNLEAQITPQQKQDALNAYTDYIARVSLGIVKNPTSGEYNYESKVKDIVYHSRFTVENITNKDRWKNGFYSGTKDQADLMAEMAEDSNDIMITSALLINIQNPKITNYKNRKVTDYKDTNDSFIIEATKEDALQLINGRDGYNTDNFTKEYVVFEPEQIHVLSSKADIEGFKEFVQEEKDDLKPFIDESNKIGDESINERLKKYEESIKIPNNVKSKVLEKIEKETEKVKEKLLSLGLKQEGNKFELITNSYATFRMKLKELENVNAIISTNKTSDFYQIIARLKNVDSTMELKKQGELPFTPIEVKQIIQEQQFLNDVADNVFEGLSEEEKQILKKKIENGDYNLNCKI